ncbi:MAG TPA: GAF domain-containing protein [Candidatus Paenibacillus intestinavium]|nr:GAF domain-containing protein [Candidatus Paenibacillus intestinavium]
MQQADRYFQTKIDQIREQFGYHYISLAFAQSAADSFGITWQYASGNLNDRYKRIILQSGKGVAGVVFKTGKPMLVSRVKDELQKEDLFNYPIIVAERLDSLVAIPLFHMERVTGVLLVGYRGKETMTKQTIKDLCEFLDGQFGDFGIKELTFN